MLRRVWLLNLLSCLAAASPASAQSDSARIAALEAKVALLDSIIGVRGFLTPRYTCDDLEAHRPKVWFPNGEYDLEYRNRQFGCFANGAVANIQGLQAQVAGLASRTAVVEAAVAGGYQVGAAVFDVVRARQVCIGDAGCDPDKNADLQIRKNKSVVIGMEANLDHTDPQDPSHSHWSQISVSQDGGTRIQQNAASTFSRGFVSHVNPCREWLNFGPDSRSSVSIFIGSVDENTCTPIPHDGAQDFVFKTDENLRRSQIIFTRPNWNLQYIFSTTLHSIDKQVDVLPPP